MFVLRNYKNILFSNYTRKGSAVFLPFLGRFYECVPPIPRPILYDTIEFCIHECTKTSNKLSHTIRCILSDERTINLKSNQGWFYLLYHNSWYKLYRTHWYSLCSHICLHSLQHHSYKEKIPKNFRFCILVDIIIIFEYLCMLVLGDWDSPWFGAINIIWMCWTQYVIIFIFYSMENTFLSLVAAVSKVTI